MAKVSEIKSFFNEVAPFYMKLDFDNIGHLVGFSQAEVTRAVVALDITDAVIEEAVSVGAQLIVSHHPLIWEPLKRVADDDSKGAKIIKMIQNGISAICLHTNMDTAEGGVNDALMAALGAKVDGLLSPHGTDPEGKAYGIARYGSLPEAKVLEDYLEQIKSSLNANGLRYISGGKPVHKIACCGGAGAGDMQRALELGCDTYVTADLKYDHFLWAKEAGLNLIDADHYCTENVVVPVMREKLAARFPEIEVTIARTHTQPIQFA